jgi:hypothetical protein
MFYQDKPQVELEVCAVGTVLVRRFRISPEGTLEHHESRHGGTINTNREI